MSNSDSYGEDYSLTLSDDDSCSSSGDSGFSIGKDKQEHEPIVIVREEPSFFTRFASIPIIQDTQKVVRKHTVGQKALDFAETMFSSVCTYLPDNAVTCQANRAGNKSLDLIETRFPIIKSPTEEVISQFESLLGSYLPEQKEGESRLMQAMNVVSSRTTAKISEKVAATIEEDRPLKQMLHAWISEHQNWSAVEPLYSFTQVEFGKLRQELFKPNISHMERIRNVAALSQTDILLPLYQKAFPIHVESTNN